SGLTAINAVGHQIETGHGIGAKNGVSADSDSWRYESTGSDPSSALNNNGGGEQVERGLMVIMIPCAQKSALRNTNMVFKSDGGQGQEPALLPQPVVVADIELPRESYLHV